MVVGGPYNILLRTFSYAVSWFECGAVGVISGIILLISFSSSSSPLYIFIAMTRDTPHEMLVFYTRCLNMTFIDAYEYSTLALAQEVLIS